MDKKILFFFFVLLFVSPILSAQSEQCVGCEEVATLTPTRMVVISDEINYVLKINLYNATNSQPLPNAVIIIHRYNDSAWAFEKVFTDDKGAAVYNFSNYKNACYNYQILFCSCDKDAVKKCCFEINNIDITKPGTPDSIDAIPLAPNQVPPDPSKIIYDYHAFPSREIYSYCKPAVETTTAPAFCLPLAIVFALLGGSLMLTGRNPLRGFDLGGIRLGKHIRYESRGRAAGYTISPVQITGVIRKTKRETAEAKAVAEGTIKKGKVGAIAKRFEEQVKPITEIRVRLATAKGAMAAAREDMSKKGVKGIGAQYADAGKLIARAAIQAVSTPIDYLRAGPEVMIGPEGRPIPIRRGAKEAGAEASGIFALLATIPGIDAEKLQKRVNELLMTTGEIKSAEFTKQLAAKNAVEASNKLTTTAPVVVKEKGKETEQKASFTVEKKQTKEVEGNEIIGITKMPDGNNTIIVKTKNGKTALAPEGTPLYAKWEKMSKENEETVGRITVKIPGKGSYYITKDEKGELHVYESASRLVDITDKPAAKKIMETKEYKDLLKGAEGKEFVSERRIAVEIGGRTYSLIKNEKGEISIFQIEEREADITATGLGKAIVSAYNGIIKENEDFEVGKKESKILSSFNEAMKEWQGAQAALLALKVGAARNAIEKANKEFLEAPETMKKADEVITNKAKEQMEYSLTYLCGKLGLDLDNYKTKDGGLVVEGLFADLAERLKKVERTEINKEKIEDLRGHVDILSSGVKLIKDYEKAATPENIRETKLEKAGIRAEKGELPKVDKEIDAYIKKVDEKIEALKSEMTKGTDEQTFQEKFGRMQQLATMRDYLANRRAELGKGEQEKAVKIAAGQLNEQEIGTLSNNHPFTGAVRLSMFENTIGERYSSIYQRPDYGQADISATGIKKTKEYEKWLDELVVASAAALELQLEQKPGYENIIKTIDAVRVALEKTVPPSLEDEKSKGVKKE